MATTTDDDGESEAKQTENGEQSLLASFNQNDVKLFWITFAGTVAGTIVSVVIVGVAVALDRSKFVGRPNLPVILLFAWVAFIGIMAAVLGVSESRHQHNKGILVRSYGRFLILVVTLGTTVFLLVLLGYAAGVK